MPLGGTQGAPASTAGPELHFFVCVDGLVAQALGGALGVGVRDQPEPRLPHLHQGGGNNGASFSRCFKFQ